MRTLVERVEGRSVDDLTGLSRDLAGQCISVPEAELGPNWIEREVLMRI